MTWKRDLFRNVLIGILVAKSLKLLVSVIAHANGFEAGFYAPMIGWLGAALVLYWLYKPAPNNSAAAQ